MSAKDYWYRPTILNFLALVGILMILWAVVADGSWRADDAAFARAAIVSLTVVCISCLLIDLLLQYLTRRIASPKRMILRNVIGALVFATVILWLLS